VTVTGTNAETVPRRRLHPLSPVLKSTRLLLIVIAGISFQGFSELGFARWLLVVVAVLIAVIILSVVSWFVTGYHVVGRELRIYEGLVWRRTRAIPLERLQAVDVVRSLLARVAGLAELKLEVVGAGKAEAPLAYLAVADAMALRDRLLRLAAGTPVEEAAPGGAAPAAEAEPGDRLIHTVANNDVLVGQLLTPQVWFVPFGVFFVILQFAFDPVYTFIGLASLVTAAIGVLRQPVRRVLEDWDFRIALGPAGLRLRRGLLDKRTQTIPRHRVQAVGVTWPLLWRAKGWLRCRIDVAGYGQQEDGQAAMQGARLLPVGTAETGRYVIGEVLPGVDLAALPLTTPPPRARWVAPLRRRILGAGLTDLVFATRDGLLTRELVVVPFARIQSVRVVQGPLQRWAGVASVHADTAGGLHAVAAHRGLAEAWWLAAELAERARRARQESFGP
jgi:putative membrane protein